MFLSLLVIAFCRQVTALNSDTWINFWDTNQIKLDKVSEHLKGTLSILNEVSTLEARDSSIN